MRPFGEVVAKPFEVRHTAGEHRKLADFLKSLDGEVRVVLEYTGRYYLPIARYLHSAGIFVSAVHAKLIHGYGNNTIRMVKTDKADAVKIANCALDRWRCLKHGCNRSDSKAAELYDLARSLVATLPPVPATKTLAAQAVAQLKAISATLAATKQEMQRLASMLPEYPVVLAMRGVGETLGPQIMAEIGDVRRFPHKKSLVAFAGVDAPPFPSGAFESANRSISKRGSPALRKALFQVMQVLMRISPSDDAVYRFLDRKRFEGKKYYVYMVAGCDKFLQIYYARVNEYLASLGSTV